MSLRGRDIKTKGPFRNHNFPEPIDSEELLKVLEKVRKGNSDAIETMILGHCRLAMSIVNRYLTIFHINNHEDLDCAAIQGIVVAVNLIVKGNLKHNNVTGYIVCYIHQYITDYIYHDTTVYSPRRKQPILIEVLDNSIGMETFNNFEIWDSLLSIANDDTEKQILKLRSKRYTDSEIGEILGLSRLKVFRIRHDLFNRWKRKQFGGKK